ncbi:hypothetical protein HCN51_55205 [Nonomuraea sp. FMUSA5-5]|uniref:Uncharacterized protein n=1 Tax=Nonomuraea composti TaxID=2720023 RepID=A0ABX1BT94_9ACTN|nr:hypothetical protein [Nonomuraea sp. FMUSA5-5]NJP98478.1 hypothetical protein [Nonomuraea sp. FMUSA5-5]
MSRQHWTISSVVSRSAASIVAGRARREGRRTGRRRRWPAGRVAGPVVALASGGLAWLGGTPAPLAILAGAAGFTGFVGMALAVMTFLTRTQD